MLNQCGCSDASPPICQRMAGWLKECGIATVVMQSTGVYWIPVYDVLEQNGFDVWLVNARETRNLPGRKSDVQESQWLLKLHTYGLLRKSFRPAQDIRAVRTCWRERAEYVSTGRHVHSADTKGAHRDECAMSTVLSDLSGVTGMRILRAIAAGERDGMRLVEFRDPNVKASKETIAGLDVGIPELDQPHAIPLPCRNRSENAHAGHSTEIAEHRRQLHIHLGERLLYTLNARAGLLNILRRARASTSAQRGCPAPPTETISAAIHRCAVSATIALPVHRFSCPEGCESPVH